MRTSRFGVKSLFNIIYATIILLPMFSVFGRLIYTQSNPNAKDSYSSLQSLKYDLQDTTDIFSGSMYFFKTDNNLNQQISLDYVNISSINALYGSISIPSSPYRFRIYYNGNNSAYSLQIDGDSTLYTTIGNLSNINNFQFNFIASTDSTNSYPNNLLFYNFSEQQKLDNAFEYSLSEFTKDNNLGGIDLFGWFTNMFLNQSNQKNALYLNFINWYMNYTLLVSAGYLIFLALIWFINYVRKILDKSMYHDFGGF